MNPLHTIAGTITAGFILAIVIAAATAGIAFNAVSFIVWIHVLAGVTWIGLLYYFNFVQVPALAEAVCRSASSDTSRSTSVTPRRTWTPPPRPRHWPKRSPTKAARVAPASQSTLRHGRCGGSAGVRC